MQTYHSAERLPKEIRLRDMGSFYAGGQKIEISGRDIIEINVNEKCDRRIIVDPNGSYQIGQMYVQMNWRITVKFWKYRNRRIFIVPVSKPRIRKYL